MENKQSKESTHFGFKTIEKNKKTNLVKEVFDNVAFKYDLMNDLMSAGMHRLWKQHLMSFLPAKSNLKILDMAGGTGDITNLILKKYPDSEITISDINHSMLSQAQKRFLDQNIIDNINYMCTDAEKIPVKDNVFDCYIISFGIRNCTNIDKVLQEAFRVLKYSGKFICLEFSHIPDKLIQKIYDYYSFNVIPKIGKLVTNNSEAYEYLVESIRKFPNADKFKEMIIDSNFKNVNYKPMSAGVVAIHYGWKI